MKSATLNREQINAIVQHCMVQLNELREGDLKLEVRDDAPLFGSGSPLDSMALVTLTMDVEDAFADHGVEVCLSDSRAMSRKQSPFRTVATLVQFIEDQMGKP